MITTTVKQPGKIAMLHICIVIFLGCFFFGVIAANVWLCDKTLWIGFVFERQVEHLVHDRQGWQELARQIFPVRFIPWCLILVIWNFSYGNLLFDFWVGWLGFSGGFVFASCLCRYGFSGIFYMFISGFPQIFLYLTAYILLVLLWDVRRDIRWSRKNQISVTAGSRRERLLFLSIVLIATGIYTFGIWLECVVNPWMLAIGA